MTIALVALTAVLFLASLCLGTSDISVGDAILALSGGAVDTSVRTVVIDIRLLSALTALLAGGALSVSGLQMQTYFSNPLAGPYVLGVSAGASMGVALMMLGTSLIAIPSWMSELGTVGSAWIGSAVVLSIILVAAHRIRDIMVILILGMMFSGAVSAFVQILQFFSNEAALKGYIIWTMGSIGSVTRSQMPWLTVGVVLGIIPAVFTIKALNMMLMGRTYAMTLGLNMRLTQWLIFGSTSLLAGTVTAFCGPIGFIGLAVPHITRLLYGTSDHRLLMPGSFLTGSSLLLLCNLLCTRWGIPLNAATSLLGIPIAVWIVLRNR